MTDRVLGVGIGVFLLILLWTAILLVCLLFCRTRTTTTVICVTLALLITGLLAVIPKTRTELTESKVVDRLFIWRMSLVVILGVSFLGSLALLVTHWMEPIYATPLRTKIRISS